jgi:AAA ATPase containing von Willebrand factor type A (vWA) domain
MNVLWNVYHYYSQFSEAVAARIRNLRSPIEKKLKDCVKIFRWDDISHWAIREAITKIHKTLHRHIKQFKVSVREYLSPLFTVSANTLFKNKYEMRRVIY